MRRVTVTILLCFVLSSCASLHNYSVYPHQDKSARGQVHFSTWPYTILEDEDIGNAVIDPEGSIWCLTAYYIQDEVPPGNLRLAADSIQVHYPELGTTRSLTRDNWRHSAYHSQERIILNVGPISVPKDYTSELRVSFVLSARDICADTLVFREPYDLTWQKR